MSHLSPFADRDSGPWYRHRWPWLLMVGPGWVLAAGAVMGWQAASHPDALVVDDYYQQGKAINQDLRRDRAAAARAIVVELDYDVAGKRLLGVVSAGGQPLAGLMHLLLVHPTDPARDIPVTVSAGPEGRFAADVPALAATRWLVQLESGARDWRVSSEWKNPAASQRLRIVAGNK